MTAIFLVKNVFSLFINLICKLLYDHIIATGIIFMYSRYPIFYFVSDCKNTLSPTDSPALKNFVCGIPVIESFSALFQLFKQKTTELFCRRRNISILPVSVPCPGSSPLPCKNQFQILIRAAVGSLTAAAHLGGVDGRQIQDRKAVGMTK